MEEREEDITAPGPLVRSLELLPPVSYEGRIKLGHLVGDPVSPVISIIGWCYFVSVIALVSIFASLNWGFAVIAIGIIGSKYWLMRGNLQMRGMVPDSIRRELRAELGEYRGLIDELEQEIVDTESGLERYLALSSLGSYEFRSANHERALACYSECYRWIVREHPDAKQLINANRLALAGIYAVSGDCSSADAWLPATKAPNYNADRAICLARSGLFAQVLEQKYPDIPENLKTLIAHESRVFSLMQCFARSTLGQEDVDQAELDAARPVSASEYTYLCTNWPELAEFVVTLPIKQREAISPIPKARVISDGS